MLIWFRQGMIEGCFRVDLAYVQSVVMTLPQRQLGKIWLLQMVEVAQLLARLWLQLLQVQIQLQWMVKVAQSLARL